MLPAVPPKVHAKQTGQDDASTSLPPETASRPKSGLRGSNQTGARKRANSGRFPVYAGPGLGLSVRSLQTFGAGSLGQVGRPVPGTALRAFTFATVSGFFPSELPAGFPKGISSVHHGFVETRKGAPTSWAGTPDGFYLDLCDSFAKCIRHKIPADFNQVAAPVPNRLGISTFTPGPIVEEIATRLM